MEKRRCDVAVVGCGPAGLSAAVNATIRRKEVFLFGGEICSPKLQKSPLVKNYLGLPEIAGRELREKFLEHVRVLGIPIHQVKVDSVVRKEDGSFSVTAGDKTWEAGSVILATGVTVHSFIEGEKRLIGKGVGYCATCDSPLFQGRDVALLAYAPEAVQEANFLAGFCRKVYFIPGNGQAAKGLNPEVEVILDEKPLAITGGEFVSGIKLEGRELAVDGVFIYRDTFLPDRLVPGLEVEDGHVKVDRNYSTSVKGVYAAGDCTGKPYQMAKAVGEGQVAALNAVQHLDFLH